MRRFRTESAEVFTTGACPEQGNFNARGGKKEDLENCSEMKIRKNASLLPPHSMLSLFSKADIPSQWQKGTVPGVS